MPLETSTYPLTSITWPNEGVIEIFDANGARLAHFSAEFLRKGFVLSWDYIKYCLACCVLAPDHELRIMQEMNKSALSPTPSPGRYHVQAKCDPCIGPRFHYRHRGPDDDHSTMSASTSRSTSRQTQFRFRLAVRDGFCIVTEDDEPVASHILPQSRPEYYEEVFGYQPGHLFEVSYGLFVVSKMHHAFDRGDWGLFPDPEDPQTLIVHVFYGTSLGKWHGKRIPQSRFRVSDPSQLPDRRLLAFHYRQCVIKHMRGFSHFPQIPVTSGSDVLASASSE